MRNVVGSLRANLPLLLLPVRIETRFADENGGPMLLVRIYPDQIHVNTHEPELTPDEVVAGQAYWEAVWRAGNPPVSVDDVKAPWRVLAGRFGAQRAAWIALQLMPTNAAAQPVGATPQPAALPVAPVYPNPPSRPSSWSKAPVAFALPDSWVVVTQQGGTKASYPSSPVQAPLAVGLTPGAGAFPSGLPVDAGMQWMVDFDQAVAAGMGIRIPLTPVQRASGFDRIVVYGVREKGDAGDIVFERLLDAHHYTDGLAFVPQGSPTNNTADSSSAFTSMDDHYEISFGVERQAALTADASSDGPTAAALLGITQSTFDHVRFADRHDVRNGPDMFTALWPATLGYFLKQMMADVFDAQQIESTRRFAIDHARPRGVLPSLRVGRTPYGLLPATSIEAVRLEGKDPALQSAIMLATQLKPAWTAGTATVPRVGATSDPDADLAGILGMDASSLRFRGRSVVGDEFMWQYLRFINMDQRDFQIWWQEHLAPGRRLLDKYGFRGWDPRVIHVSFPEDSYEVPFPTIQSTPLSETDGLAADADLGGGNKGNYIQWLRSASIADIRAESYPGPTPTSLLYKILRQSVLLQYGDLAATAQIGEGILTVAEVKEPELVNVEPGTNTLTTWQMLDRPVAEDPTKTWAEYLVALDPPAGSPFAPLAELRAALDNLASLPTAELDRLLTETLDACSHRLDVWTSAIAIGLLQALRAQPRGAKGLYLGAFGWVENVRPAKARFAVAEAESQSVRTLDQLRSKTDFGKKLATRVPQAPLADNGGFIHAPSMMQAAVAAILRNGYMTHRYAPTEGLLAIDLSSERVRRALTLVDGVRQGQPLAALLGYRFEDGMHEKGLDKYVQAFRNQYPIVAGKLTPAAGQSAESIAASNVVDGNALQRDADNLRNGQNWESGLPGPGSDRDTVIALLADLDDCVDAISDLSVAESVYQVTRGNFERASGLMDAVSKGMNPPEVQVADTPRGGLDLTHRVMIFNAGVPVVAAPWAGIPTGPRATYEPRLDAWLSTLLPDPATVTCGVNWHDAGGNAHQKVVALADLDVGPLDVLALSTAADTAARSELENRILTTATVPGDASQIQIAFAKPVPAPGTLSFPELFVLARALRDLVVGARPLEPQDLIEPERNAAANGGSIDVAELNTRATNAINALTDVHDALVAAAPGLPGTSAAARAALFGAAGFAVPSAIPVRPGGSNDALAAQVKATIGALKKRVDEANAIALAADKPDSAYLALQKIFGGGFIALARFTPPDLANLRQAFAQSAALAAVDADAPDRWMQQLTHIRPGVSRLDSVTTTAQLIAESARPQLTLGQLPLTANDRWLALPPAPGASPARGRVAVAALASGDIANQNSWWGLMVDQWVERLPSASENAAVTFHYEEPKARAPQAMILAVCPDARESWDGALIDAIIEETLDLAKMRAVDLTSIVDVGQILPALYFALNLQGDTVSSRFDRVKEQVVARNIIGPS